MGGNQTTAAPSEMGGNITGPTTSPAPTPTPVIRVRVGDYYLAYVSNQNPLVEPTPEQYAAQADVTTRYFEDFFRASFANSSDTTFLGAESNLDYTLFQAGIPAERFNLYMDYSYMDLIYSIDSDPPDAAMSFELMRASISEDFIRNYVWNTTKSAFATVNEVVMRGSTMPNPNATNSTERSSGEIQERSGERDDLPVGTLAAAGGAALVIMAVGILLFRRTRSPTEYMDGIYALDDKGLEGYFGEHSVTEEASENASRFPPLHMVEDDRYDGASSEHQPLREQP